VPLQTEAVEQRLLHHPPFAHHRPNLLQPSRRESAPAPQSSGVFQRNSQIAVIRWRLGERAIRGQLRPIFGIALRSSFAVRAG
jgi:hypothetical protein